MNCNVCQSEIEPARNIDGKIRKNQIRKYCSPACARKHHRELYRPRTTMLGVASATVGTVSELLVAVKLMENGWSVFKSLSPASAFDLIAFKNGVMKKVEVKTGHRWKDGKVSFPKHPHSHHDHMAIVVEAGEILFNPVIEL